jgi:hypothetical protein
MAPSIVKAFTVHLNVVRRRELKHKVIMASCNLLSESRYLFAMSVSNELSDLIEDRMKRIVTVFVDEFLRRCRSASKTPRERQYVAAVVRKHIVPTVNLTFERHVERLNRLDRLNIINGETTVPRFLIMGKVDRFKGQMEKMNKKMKTQVTI